MAELVVSMVVKPLLSSLMDKVSSYLLIQYDVLEGMELQHATLKRKLPAIIDVINDAEHVATHRDGANAWLQALKTVALEANDIFDEFHYEACCRQAKKNNHNRELGLKSVTSFPCRNRLMFRRRMSRRLRTVMDNIDVLMGEMKAFKFKYQQQGQESKQNLLTDSIIVDPVDIIRRSRHADKETIVKILTAPASYGNLLVHVILGMGGLGKTTLAQLVFNDQKVQDHFEVRKWVCVSEDFDVRDIARQIYEGLAEMNVDIALKKLRDELSKKRYLLVLDNVGNKNTDKWEKLKACLQHGAVGSALLVTTRSKEVACEMHSAEVHAPLASLEKMFIKEIIETRALGLRHVRSVDMVDNYEVLQPMVDAFADRCAGSPLAAKAIGSMLRTKRTSEEWRLVLSESNICNMGDGIYPILKLSLDDLASDVRQCFIFCAMFPKGRPIQVEKLIQLWIANGFVQGNNHLETTGKQIFEELVSRSFFEDVKQMSLQMSFAYVGDRYYSTCMIHNLMHDIAASTMEKECYTAIESSSLEHCPDNARHIHLSFPATNDSLKRISPTARTVICESQVQSPILHLPKNVRALQLHSCCRSIPIKPKHLYLLRYLDLSNSSITALPEDITTLFHLEVLNLSGCISLVRLPRLMRYMTNLRHLDMYGCYSLEMMPQDLGKLTALQTLSWFVASRSSGCSTLQELQNLNISGQLQLFRLEHVTEEEARGANLRKKDLRHLTFKWTRGCEDNTNVIEALEPHGGLQTLTIDCYGGTNSPTWMCSLQNLVQFCLSNCRNIQFLITGAGFCFPNLKELRLYELPMLESLWEINDMEVEQILFPKLERLCIRRCTKLMTLQGQATFPSLHDIRIISCPEMRIPFEAQNVSKLGMEGPKQQMMLWAAKYSNSLIQLDLNMDSTETISSDEHPIELMVGDRTETISSDEHPTEVMVGDRTETISSDEHLIEPMVGDSTETISSEEHPFELMVGDSTETIPYDEHPTELMVGDRTETISSDEHPVELMVGDSTEIFSYDEHPVDLMVGEQKGNYNYLRDLFLERFIHSDVLKLCSYFVWIENLSLRSCDSLVYWPEEFKSLIALRQLLVFSCKNLVGCAHSEPSTSEASQLLPRLVSLFIYNCESLIEIFNVPGSVRDITVSDCQKLASLGRHFPPCLTSLIVHACNSLTEINELPLSLTELDIDSCNMLKSVKYLSGELSIEIVTISSCETLSSLPDGLQAAPSLKILSITSCPAIKKLPSFLNEQKRLGILKLTYHCTRHRVSLSKPKSWKYCLPSRLANFCQ